MKVLKVGGGVLTGPEPVRALVRLVKPDRFALVVSAFGKTTNHLEQVVEAFLRGDEHGALEGFDAIIEWHRDLAAVLGVSWRSAGIPETVADIRHHMTRPSSIPAAAFADRVVALGEQLSSRIVASFLAASGVPAHWIDATRVVRTDDSFGRARVLWEPTRQALRSSVGELAREGIPIIAGFIGSAADGATTTLGREGSDYTAALVGAALDADEVVLLKNVPGVLTADPGMVPDAHTIPQLSFDQAQRLFRAGAKVVHPKTIGPLRDVGIPLRVAAFPSLETGTTIGAGRSWGSAGIRAVATRQSGRNALRTSVQGNHDGLLSVLAEPPLTSTSVRRVDDTVQALHLTVRHRDTGRGTWITLVDPDGAADAMRGLHMLVDYRREEQR